MSGIDPVVLIGGPATKSLIIADIQALVALVDR